MIQRGCIAHECPSPLKTPLSSPQVPKFHPSLLPLPLLSLYTLVSPFAYGPAYTDRSESAVTAGPLQAASRVKVFYNTIFT